MTERNVIDHDLCTLCELCVDACVRQVLKVVDQKIAITLDTCIKCGHCQAVCPEDAVELPGLDQNEFIPITRLGDMPTAEQLLEFLRSRRSTRIFSKRPVEDEKIKTIVEAGRFAPTGGNCQPVQFNIVKTPKIIEDIRREALDVLSEQGKSIAKILMEKERNGDALTAIEENAKRVARGWQEGGERNRPGEDRLFFDAPALFCLHTDPRETPIADIDASLASMQMVLMAEALGLGSCYIGYLVRACSVSASLKKSLEIPEDNNFRIAFVAGYPEIAFQRLVARNPARITVL